MHAAIAKNSAPQFGIVERAMIKQTIFKGELQAVFIRAVEPEPQHFAILKTNIAEYRSEDLCIAEVATCECTVYEQAAGQGYIAHITIDERAAFVLTSYQWGVLKINVGKCLLFCEMATHINAKFSAAANIFANASHNY